jgi:hypothetical protein
MLKRCHIDRPPSGGPTRTRGLKIGDRYGGRHKPSGSVGPYGGAKDWVPRDVGRSKHAFGSAALFEQLTRQRLAYEIFVAF